MDRRRGGTLETCPYNEDIVGVYRDIGGGLSVLSAGFGLWPGFVQQAVNPQIVQSSSSAGLPAGGFVAWAAEPAPVSAPC